MIKAYVYFGGFERFWAAKNKANLFVRRSACCVLRKWNLKKQSQITLKGVE